MSDPINTSSLYASLRRLLATALEMAQVRLDLLSTEIEFEKRRLFDGLLWGGVALLLLGIGLVLLCGFVILLFWEGYRLAAIGTMAAFFLVTGGLFMRTARLYLQKQAGIFSTSVAELERDRTELKNTAPHEQG